MLPLLSASKLVKLEYEKSLFCNLLNSFSKKLIWYSWIFPRERALFDLGTLNIGSNELFVFLKLNSICRLLSSIFHSTSLVCLIMRSYEDSGLKLHNHVCNLYEICIQNLSTVGKEGILIFVYSWLVPSLLRGDRSVQSSICYRFSL